MKDGLDKRKRVIRRILAASTHKGLVDMTVITSLLEEIGHVPGSRHEGCGLAGREVLLVGGWSLQAIHSLVCNHYVNARV